MPKNVKRFLRFIRNHKWWIMGMILFAVIVIVGMWVYAVIITIPNRYDSAYTKVEDVPKRSVAIVFGAKENNGSPSPYLQFRLESAIALYNAGTVKKLLMSGDNSTPGYDEPTVMGNTALKFGVKREDIVLDYAGFSTFDTCYRAKNIFGVTSAILVTQNYHLPRAIFTCEGVGIDSIGYGAFATEPLLQAQYTVREWFSMDKTALQLLTHAKSKYLGKQELMTY
jgi:vancomycin permeability regulator SanA